MNQVLIDNIKKNGMELIFHDKIIAPVKYTGRSDFRPKIYIDSLLDIELIFLEIKLVVNKIYGVEKKKNIFLIIY